MGYDSDYLDSSDPGSYEDKSGESEVDDAKRYKASNNCYCPNTQLEDFYLDLRFDDLKSFKHELVQFSIRKGFAFQYVKNDGTRVREKCAAKGCKWLVFCSWCSGKKMHVLKKYIAEHSCLVGTSKNRRVTGKVIANRFFDVINGMPFIKPRHLKAMVRKELGVFISDKVCRNAKAIVLRKLKKQFKEDFLVLNSYVLELKEANPESTVTVVSKRQEGLQYPIFQRIYICLIPIREGFMAGCRNIIGLDGCFLKGLVKGMILMVVGRDGNNQMFPVAWAVVENETTESWVWFIQHLSSDLRLGDGLGWSTNKVDMLMHLDRMRGLKRGTSVVEDLLENWPIEGWCCAFFNDVLKCEVIDNNMCETFNGVILEARHKAIITMFEDIRQYCITRIVVKRENTGKWKSSCGPRICARIEKERAKSGKWQVE
ncbi:uncharacterized protein LOC120273202 [Dioscorea cayenensis subsp. rotundata]|uniref:Uncharacterized protein LOC120273202 n=1 Tax=Dioscorea cayennensis subsp. rotundata TaxID=55577 RepID=A0AB40CAF2_DIOCR|nr:uncharacterized protein LOC120273202 [Dioscorea cayenensis subsp. rotundata]